MVNDPTEPQPNHDVARDSGTDRTNGCWETAVGSHNEHPTLCGRCVEAVSQFKE
ncbi:MAG TPA: hypothetical protein VIK28_11800 [Sedimentisphaerales bacterium]